MSGMLTVGKGCSARPLVAILTIALSATAADQKIDRLSIALSNGSAFAVKQAARSTVGATSQQLRAVHRKVTECVAKHKDQNPSLDRFLALAELRVEKACIFINRGYSRYSYLPDEIVRPKQELDRAEAIVTAIERGDEPTLPSEGLVESAFYSKIDGSPQPYVYYLPRNRPKRGELGLFVFLHGYARDLDKVNWIYYMYSDKLNGLAEAQGMVPVLPFGRSNTEFMGVGEVDVLEAIAQMKRLYPIDEQRVFLSGGSMGGSGAYTIACHYPHLFAGIAPIAGRHSYYLWKDIDRQTYVGFKRIQTDIDYAEAIAQNLRNVSAHIFHGGQDRLIKIGQSRDMAKLLQRLGQPVEYTELSDGDHWIWGRCFTHPLFCERLRKARAPRWPRTVRLKTYTLKYDRAYWVHVRRLERWGPPATVEATLRTDSAIQLTTSNVAGLTLIPNTDFLAGRDRVDVVLNGQTRHCRVDDGQLHVQLTEDTGSGTPKTPSICGPAREAYCSKFLMVFGTQSDDDTDLSTALKAGHEWVTYAKGRAAIKSDTLVTQEDIARHNLILFGDAESNSLIGRVAPRLPVQISEDEITLAGRSFSRPAANLLMIYPNPLNPSRYVLLNVGTFWGRHLGINHKLDHVPDFIVFKDIRAPDGNNEFLCAGYFGNNWQFREDLIWDAGKGNEGKTPVQ